MSAHTMDKERSQLYRWIDNLPPNQFDLVYRLVRELVESEPDDTAYLLSSKVMRERLLAARDSGEGIPLEIVRKKPGI